MTGRRLPDAPAAPARAAGDPPPYAWVAPSHPWHAEVQHLREEIAAHGALAGRGRRVQAELKGVRETDGRWRLERAYWSVQRRDALAPHGLAADTLSVDLRDKGAPREAWLRLPDDPYLVAVATRLPAFAAEGARADILRYVPLRRLTFRLRDAEGRVAIGKFKRRSRYGEAYALLGSVATAFERLAPEVPGGLGFVVSAPVSVAPEHAMYLQTCLAGDDLAERMTAGDAAAWMRALGRRQARLQGASTRGLPDLGPRAQLAQARSDLAWIAWMRPELADVLAPLAEAVEAVPTWDDAQAAFCHGDLVCSQCLVPAGGPDDPTPWGITDFDLCHRGDPCRDLAILLASLDEDVALLADEAAGAVDPEALAQACLEGQREEASRLGRGAPDAGRLRWQRLCAELYYLGLMLKKDRYRPALFARRLERAQRHAGLKAWA